MNWRRKNDQRASARWRASSAYDVDGVTDHRVIRWAVTFGAAAMVLIGVVLLYLLTVSSSNREQYEVGYTRLFALNIVVASALGVLILWLAIGLIVRLKQRKFGSQLLVKLALIFGLVGILPGLLIYVVSYQFVSRSIESWFDVQVENALSAGLSLGRSTLDVLSVDLANKTRKAALALNDQSDVATALSIDRVRDQLSVDEVVLWSSSGHIVVSSGVSGLNISPERLNPQTLRQLKTEKLITTIEDFDETPNQANPPRAFIKVLVLVADAGFSIRAEPRVLQVVQYLSPVLVANANAVGRANSEYHERALAREGLRRMYIGTLTLALFLSVLGSVLLAIVLGAQLAKPLLLLAQGMQQVARGDLQPKKALQGKDELDGLTRSFAAMTQQILQAQAAQALSNQEINQERGKLQTILDNLSAGVLVIDGVGKVLSANPAAASILRHDLHRLQGGDFATVVQQPDLVQTVIAQFNLDNERALRGSSTHWQAPVMLQWGPTHSGEMASHQEVHLIVRGAVLPDVALTSLKLIVFDDITEVVSAQRSLAWGEVARRLAHEIKNPLTPIQLSAQRLERRLSGKLDDGDELILQKSVLTIVTQVDAMKNLVNEFREYARLPLAQLAPVHLNALVGDVCQLYADEQASSTLGAVGVELLLDPTCPAIQGDSGQLRQVVHNLIQNAQDACAESQASVVQVSTHWLQATGQVRLSVTDNGPGFAENVLSRAIEPYVTTKVSGTGLGLAVVKKIADEHKAKLDISNRMVEGVIVGAQVSLTFGTLTPIVTTENEQKLPTGSAA